MGNMGTARSEQPPAFDENGVQVVFTLVQVRSLLERALQEKEAELTARYDSILQDRLADQFAMFSKFNQDHIHTRVNDTDFSYLS
jgi:hypothetical protein